MNSEITIYEQTFNAAVSAVNNLYLSGFITEAEKANIDERIGNYTDRYKAITGDSKILKSEDEKVHGCF